MFSGDVYKLLEGTPDAAFVVTLEGEICFWNKAAEQLFGHKAEDVLTTTCYGVLQGKDALGTVVCTRECSVHHCAAHDQPIPLSSRGGDTLWAANLVSVSTIVFEDSRSGKPGGA